MEKKERHFHFIQARCEEAAALLKCPSEYLIAFVGSALTTKVQNSERLSVHS